ncbi:MAG: hypothetical protein ABT940_08335 [Alphaproteobacteria bacterium]
MRSRFLTEDDLRHFTRNGARVRGGVDRDTQRIDRSSLERERGVKGAQPIVQFSAPAPSHRYEYQGQVYKSKTEVRFAMHLDALKHAGEVARWQYEPVNFRLPGKKNFYCPDFLIENTTYSTPIFVDTKGFNKSDDRSLVKIKTAAGLNRWATFKQVRYLKGAWIERLIEVN